MSHDADREQHDREGSHDHEGEAGIHVAGAEEAVAERVDHVEDRVHVRELLAQGGSSETE